MRYLLDTNIVLLWLKDESLVGWRIQEIIRDSEHVLFVSSVSIWEIAIKRSNKKLKITPSYHSILIEEDFTPLPVTYEHAHEIENLHVHADHKDPFDRMLIAQAIVEHATLITTDKMLERYPVEVIRV